ncbi:hypothetical protein [Fictibacillus sp. NRS-1165]|uniref:hypothetical protein n=1 Tax=Fictibacillus sp. NRS-1165 TaxID=3144463 RepID=UPI003D1DCDD2
MANRYEKYLWLEFSYFENNEHIILLYAGYKKYVGGLECAKCGKKLKTGHIFTAMNRYEEEWIFGSECVKAVFGEGLKKLNE